MSRPPSSNGSSQPSRSQPAAGPSSHLNETKRAALSTTIQDDGPSLGGAANHLTRSQLEIVKRLVSQVARAFFDPPWVVVLERMMTKDAWLDQDLARSVGVPKVIEARQFFDALRKQRLINYHMSHERNPNWDPTLRRGKKVIQRCYWYIDYREFVLSARYRLGRIGEKLEGERKEPVENIASYACPLCKKEFHELDVPDLMQPLPNGDFSLVCDVCASEVEQKADLGDGRGPGKRDKVDKENDRLTRWNDLTRHLVETIKMVQPMGLEPFDIEPWLLENIEGTVAMEIDDRGRRVLPKEIREESAAVVATTEEEALQRAKEELERIEKQRLSDALPVWHTQSTVSGEQTALGLSHQNQTDRRLQEAKVAVQAAQTAKDVEADAELEAYYAELEAEGGAGIADDGEEDMEEIEPTSAGPSNGTGRGSFPPSRSGSVSSGAGSPRSPATPGAGGGYDSDASDLEDASEGIGRPAPTKEDYSSRIINVRGRPYTLADIEASANVDDSIADMTTEEYEAYEALISERDEAR